jgi:D-arabinonate dehydratase/D-galactarolactone cycloisomerase
MRIRDVRTIPLEYPLPQPVYDANYIMATKPALLVEVETDDGVVGLGEAAHFGGPLRSTQVVIEGAQGPPPGRTRARSSGCGSRCTSAPTSTPGAVS